MRALTVCATLVLLPLWIVAGHQFVVHWPSEHDTQPAGNAKLHFEVAPPPPAGVRRGSVATLVSARSRYLHESAHAGYKVRVHIGPQLAGSRRIDPEINMLAFDGLAPSRYEVRLAFFFAVRGVVVQPCACRSSSSSSTRATSRPECTSGWSSWCSSRTSASTGAMLARPVLRERHTMGRKPAFGRGPPSTPCANRLHTREQDVYDGRRCSYSITLVPHEEPGCLHYTGVPTGGGGGTPSTSCVRRPKCVSRAEGHGVVSGQHGSWPRGQGWSEPCVGLARIIRREGRGDLCGRAG